ncbi:unnamed protein product [Protopolystoma xenopodis]|uniref:Uncharacterized protein n=1 Tax=Protopolystoma xenopodis TaxID=117903 RepID=A0A448WEC2_9PLAT|nr:unnamed protein product [Protopolystoma xenopodis]
MHFYAHRLASRLINNPPDDVDVEGWLYLVGINDLNPLAVAMDTSREALRDDRRKSILRPRNSAARNGLIARHFHLFLQFKYHSSFVVLGTGQTWIRPSTCGGGVRELVHSANLVGLFSSSACALPDIILCTCYQHCHVSIEVEIGVLGHNQATDDPQPKSCCFLAFSMKPHLILKENIPSSLERIRTFTTEWKAWVCDLLLLYCGDVGKRIEENLNV